MERAEVQRLAQLVAAMAAMVPPADAGAVAPQGDIRAHVDKAGDIARELMAPGTAARPIGTSGDEASVVTIDRTAVQRLEIELDAIAELLPRQMP